MLVFHLFLSLNPAAVSKSLTIKSTPRNNDIIFVDGVDIPGNSIHSKHYYYAVKVVPIGFSHVYIHVINCIIHCILQYLKLKIY